MTRILAVTAVAALLLLAPGRAGALVIVGNYAGFDPNEEAILEAVMDEWEAFFTCTEGHTLTIDFVCDPNLNDGVAPGHRRLATTDGWDDANSPRPDVATITFDNPLFSWVMDPNNIDGYDAWQTASHEVAHGLGFTVNYVNFRNSVKTTGGNRYFDMNDSNSFDAGDVDLIDLGPDPVGTHYPDANQTNLMERFADPNQRLSPTREHAKMLSKAFGYVMKHVGTSMIRRREAIDWGNKYTWEIETDGTYDDIHIHFSQPETVDPNSYTGPGTARMEGSTLIIETDGVLVAGTTFSIETQSTQVIVFPELAPQSIQLSLGGHLIPGTTRFISTELAPLLPNTHGFFPTSTHLAFGADTFEPDANIILYQSALDPTGGIVMPGLIAAPDGSLAVDLPSGLELRPLVISVDGNDWQVPIQEPNAWLQWYSPDPGIWGDCDSDTGKTNWAKLPNIGLDFPGPASNVLIRGDVTIEGKRLVNGVFVEIGGLTIEGKLHANHSMNIAGYASLRSGGVLSVGDSGDGAPHGFVDYLGYQGSGGIAGHWQARDIWPDFAGGLGALTVRGSLTLGDSSNFGVVIDGMSYNRLNISGTAHLDGAVWPEIWTPPPLPPGLYAIDIISAGTIDGTFDVGPIDGEYYGSGVFSKGIVYGPNSVQFHVLLAPPGDADGDGEVTNLDVGTAFGNFGDPGDWPDADFDGDFQITNLDIGTALGSFGTEISPTVMPFEDEAGGPGPDEASGAAHSELAGALVDNPNRADLIYDAATGNVKLDPTEAAGGKIINFVLWNDAGGDDFSAPGSANSPWNSFFFTDTPMRISESDGAMQGFTEVWDLGDIFPTDMTLAELQNFLTAASYVGHLGTGQWDLDLVPEPTTMGLLALGALALRRRRRRRR